MIEAKSAVVRQPSTRHVLRSVICPDLRKIRVDGDCSFVPKKPPLQPDPGIYSQQQRVASGQSATWDSPDITTNLSGKVDDFIRVTVRNYSSDASAIGTRVQLDYSEFGIGFPRTSLGMQTVNLAKKGLPASSVEIKYFVPASIREKLDNISVFVAISHSHDRQRENNYGEQAFSASGSKIGENTFDFSIHNRLASKRTFELKVFEREWSPNLSTTLVTLTAGETQKVRLSVMRPSDASNRQTFNIVALEKGGSFYGGIHHRFDL